MKKHFLITAVILVNIHFIACNGSSDNGSQTPDNNRQLGNAPPPNPCEGIDSIDICDSAGGIGNFIVKSSDARNMISNFETIFKKEAGLDIRAFEPIYWLNKCEIFGIEDFLKTRTDPTTGQKFDGIRLHMACEATPSLGYGTDPYKQRTTLFIFPTISRPTTDPTISSHKDVKTKIPLTGTCVSTFLQDNGIANPQIEAFETVYRKMNVKDSLSSAVWVDACVIFTIAKVLRLSQANIDGLNINMASYDKTIKPITPVSGRIKDTQSTVILVPTHLVNGKQENYWDIVDCLYKTNKHKAAAAGGFNHGELCPQKCD